ncbi:unnamed protein product [Aphanomyces euteiches]
MDKSFMNVFIMCHWRRRIGSLGRPHGKFLTENIQYDYLMVLKKYTLEVLDPFTVYRAFQNVHESSSAHVNMIYKYYVECNREVIVWRSVLEDALVPRMAQGTVTNKWGWLVVEPTADAESCRVTFLLQVVPAPLQNDQKATLADYLTAAKVMAEKYAFGQPPEIPGTFPGGAVNETIEAALTFARRTFVEHDKELEWSLKCAIDQVVLEYQASHAERYLFSK